MNFRATSLVLALSAGFLAAGCDAPSRDLSKLPPEAVRGNGETPYPGPIDQRLTPEQQSALRERGNLQR